MGKLLKNITKLTLSVLTAFSVFTLNFSSFVHCSALNTSDECCHVTHTVKKCCAKNQKITLNERITSHCGCSVKQAPPATDLYNDLKNSGQFSNQKFLLNNSSSNAEILNVIHSNKIIFYSPPQKYQTDTYLTNLAIRI